MNTDLQIVGYSEHGGKRYASVQIGALSISPLGQYVGKCFLCGFARGFPSLPTMSSQERVQASLRAHFRLRHSVRVTCSGGMTTAIEERPI